MNLKGSLGASMKMICIDLKEASNIEMKMNKIDSVK